MNHLFLLPPAPWTRRRVIQGLGAGALGALFGGCATVPQAPPRPLDRALAPRVGESWRYQYTSAIRNVPPRVLELRVLEVTDEGVRDRLSAEGEAAGDERRFGSALELVARPVSGLVVHEFSPYLLAFGGFPAGAGSFAATVPPSSWGTQWTATATLRGSERITVPAGSFDALRVELRGSRPFIRGQMDDAIDPVWLDATVWYAPAAKRVVQLVHFTQAWGRNFLARDQHQLVAHRPG
jgi:hypothetical protein